MAIKVTFLHVGDDSALAEKMVQSVIKAIKGAEIVQLTDMLTEPVKGVHSVIRKPYDGNLMTFRMLHLAELKGEWITLDTDVIVLKDLSEVFKQDFDVALTKRTGPILDNNGIDIARIMPYNTGVMFSKNQMFWKSAYKTLVQMPAETHKWYGDQLSVRITADSTTLKVLELDCEQYNYTPNTADERKDCYVLHFKGNRKDWMLNGNYDIQRATNSRRKLVKPR